MTATPLAAPRAGSGTPRDLIAAVGVSSPVSAARVWSRYLIDQAADAQRRWDVALDRDFDATAHGRPLSRELAATRAALLHWCEQLAEKGATVAVANLVDAFRDAD